MAQGNGQMMPGQFNNMQVNRQQQPGGIRPPMLSGSPGFQVNPNMAQPGGIRPPMIPVQQGTQPLRQQGYGMVTPQQQAQAMQQQQPMQVNQQGYYGGIRPPMMNMQNRGPYGK